jgi:SAM-dependent methyltransferase
LVHRVAGRSVLDLGCGAGRLAHALAGLGHEVVGVDISPEMLAWVRVPRVCGDIRRLALHRRFDSVVLASYLVNEPDAVRYLTTCREHVRADGSVIVQRYSPMWVRTAFEDEVTVGAVTIGVRSFTVEGHRFTAVVEYRLADARWEQPIRGEIVEDLESLVGLAGLRFDTWLDEFQTWARLEVAP